MKKLNNKGFAFSTLLYGLLLVAFLTVNLMMSFIQTNRRNTTTLVSTIEEEINRFGRTETEFLPSGADDSQEYIVPYGKAGWYRVEIWAAAKSGNNGTYVRGDIYLDENDHLYFFVGTIDEPTTDVRLISAASKNDPISQKSIIMKAGCGGTGIGTGGIGSQSVSYVYGYGGADEKVGHTPTTEGANPPIELRYFTNVSISPNAYSGTAGKAKIEKLTHDIENRTPGFTNNPARVIVTGSNLSNSKIYAMYKGKNIATGQTTGTSQLTANITFPTVDPTQVLDEIAVVPNSASSLPTINSITIQNSSGSNIVFQNGRMVTSGMNGINGYHAYARSYTRVAPQITGVYYIQNSQNKSFAFTLSSNIPAVKPLTGTDTQIWTIERIEGTDKYKIINTSNQLALTGNGSSLAANCKYNDCPGQKDWYLNPIGDGSYSICLYDNRSRCIRSGSDVNSGAVCQLINYSSSLLNNWFLIEA